MGNTDMNKLPAMLVQHRIHGYKYEAYDLNRRLRFVHFRNGGAVGKIRIFYGSLAAPDNPVTEPSDWIPVTKPDSSDR